MRNNVTDTVVLMYHALECKGCPSGVHDPGEYIYVLDVESFFDQMRYLHEAGFRTLLLDEILTSREFPERSVVLTFDDGHRSNRSLALPILQQFGFRAVFFITTGWINTPYYLRSKDIRILAEAGMGIGSHGVTHTYFDELNEAKIEEELAFSRNILEEIVSSPIWAFSAPGGRLKSGVTGIAFKNGYRAICTSYIGTFSISDSSFAVPRFAIRRDTKLDDFRRIVDKDYFFIKRMQIRARILAIAKYVLGNHRYDVFRRLALKLFG